jgi:hypothetical protein
MHGLTSELVGYRSKGVGFPSKGVGFVAQHHDCLNRMAAFLENADVFRCDMSEYGSIPVVNGAKADCIQHRTVSSAPSLDRYASSSVRIRTKTAADRLRTDGFLSKTARNPSILVALQARNDGSRG